MGLKDILKINSDENFALLMGPLAGVTDYAYRELCYINGADVCFTEMTSAKGICYDSEHTWDLIRENANGPLSVQLFGSEKEFILKSAELILERYRNVLSFDLNMGCPAPKIVKNGDGSSLMKSTEKAAGIVELLKRNLKVPVSVKFRKGFDDEHINALDFAKAIEQAGADYITVHGRTREQFYSGKADWDIIKEIKKNALIPVVANGDVFTPEDAKSILEYTGCDGVMVARGALGNPFIFSQIREYFRTGTYTEPSAKQISDTVLNHYRLMKEDKGDYKAIVELRKHMCWYMKGMSGAARLRTDALKISSESELVEFLNKVFV